MRGSTPVPFTGPNAFGKQLPALCTACLPLGKRKQKRRQRRLGSGSTTSSSGDIGRSRNMSVSYVADILCHARCFVDLACCRACQARAYFFGPEYHPSCCPSFAGRRSASGAPSASATAKICITLLPWRWRSPLWPRFWKLRDWLEESYM